MARSDLKAIRFVRALLPEHRAERFGTSFEVRRPDRMARLDAASARQLADIGVVTMAGQICMAGPRAASWLVARGKVATPVLADAVLVATDESPLARLAAPSGQSEPFLLAHHIEAGERMRRLIERGRLMPKVTMSYDATRTGGGPSNAGTMLDPSESMVDARRRLDAIARLLPSDCFGVLFDVCGALKGLQTIEIERRWPRRSAKLVLRIGLEQLAQHFGLTAVATGTGNGAAQVWRSERLPLDF